MFIGVYSYQDAQSVHSYETACAALERASKTPTGKNRTEKHFGFHLGMSRNHGVTWVRKDPSDGSINFRLYDTDVVIWYPDNSVEIDNFGTVTTSSFAARFLPGGMHLAHPTETRGVCGGHRGIYYGAADGTRMVCFGGLPRFREDGDGRVPDADTIDTLEFPEFDQQQARTLSKRYPLKDLEKWLAWAPLHMDLQHDGWDLDACVEALEKRDFTTAAMHLPLITIPNGWGAADRIKPLPITTQNRDHVVTMGSIKKLRLALCEHEGLISTIEFGAMPATEFDRRMVRVRELRALELTGWGDYGPDR